MKIDLTSTILSLSQLQSNSVKTKMTRSPITGEHPEVSNFWKVTFEDKHLFALFFFCYYYSFSSTRNPLTNHIWLVMSLLLHLHLLICICTAHQPLLNNYIIL